MRPSPERLLTTVGWMADYLDPHDFLNVAVHRFVPSWRNADYEHLLNMARHMTDLAERTKVYQAADRILIEEAAILPLAYSQTHLLIKPWVKQFPISPYGAFYWKDVIIGPH